MKRVLIIISMFFMLVGCNVLTNLKQNNSVLKNLPSKVTINEGEYIDLIKLTLPDDVKEEELTYKISTSVVDTTSLEGGEHKIVYTVTDEDGVIKTKEIIINVRSLFDRLNHLLQHDSLTVDDYLEATKLMFELEGANIPEDDNFGDLLHQFHILYSESFIIYDDELDLNILNKDLFYEDEDFLFLNEDKEVIIKYKNLSKKDVIIPDGVKVIGFEAFCQTDIESVVIPSSMETIESNAFRLTSLSSVYLPENVKKIGIEAFDYHNLNDLSVSLDNQYYTVKNNGLLSKDGKIFYRLSGKHNDYSIPVGVTVIARKAFSNKHNYDQLSHLGSVHIPDGVVVIGEEAFEYNSLINLTIPDSTKAIGRAAFYSNNLIELTIPNNVVEIWPYAFWENDINELTTGTGVKIIENHAFGANDLTTITIPEGVVEIKNAAFCSNPTTTVFLSSTVTSIGIESFNYAAISNFQINENNHHIKVQNNGILSYDGTVYYTYIGKQNKYDIPQGVVVIGFKAFSCANLSEVTIPDTVTTIEKYAFYQNQLRDITIPENVTEIEEGAFLSNQFYNITILGDEKRFNDQWSLIGFPNRLLP